MGKVYGKHILRTITGSIGRYLAIFAIVALGAGFFSGLCTTKKAMLETGNDYFAGQSLYHFRAVSDIGFDGESAAGVADATGTEVYGGISADMLTVYGGQESVLHCLSLTDGINEPTLTGGRMPEKDNEVLADRRMFDKDDIGKTVKVGEQTAAGFAYGEYKITGIANSPLYIGLDRGTTTYSDGKTDGFLLMREGGFASDIFTELYIDAGIDDFIYSDQYEKSEEELLPAIEAAVRTETEKRANRLAVQAAGNTPAGAGGLEARTYVFTRDDDASYSSFESNAEIVESVAKVFPLFFMAVAALVCSTTMTRMIDEQRTEIGTLRALGFGNGAVLFKYVFYAGSAALLGCAAGFFGGSRLFPAVIWKAYGLIYGFTSIKYTLSAPIGVISLCGAMLASAGVTWAVCRKRLAEMPAQLIRPRAPAAGKRIFAEHIRFFWNRLSFLHKVTARNVFRYKKRMIMMLVGIGGCTALVLTGFGIKDSVSNIVDYQFSDIMKYDIAINCSDGTNLPERGELAENGVKDYTVLRQETADIKGKSTQTANLLIAEKDLGGLVDLHDVDGTAIAYPKTGEAVINTNLAKLCGAGAGDTVTLKNGGNTVTEVKISALCENYVYNYIYISADTYGKIFGEYKPNTVFATLKSGADPHRTAAALQSNPSVAGVAVTADIRSRVNDSMKSLNAVVWVVILSAGALALIVLFNLGNINITERVREIATVKVLGFHAGETASYVFRENRVLTVMGTLAGLPFGVLLHRFVMSQIRIDMVSFRVTVLPRSYVFTFLIVAAFAFLTELLMLRGVYNIPMAESLKSTE